MTESWKSVSEPYWVDDETVRIDCEGQNLVPGVYYYCEGFIESGCDIPLHTTGVEITSANPIGYVQFKRLVQSYNCVLPVDTIIKLHDSDENIYVDEETRTIPEPPPNFEFVEDECYIQYGDDSFCFADEPTDIPIGANIWVYFRVKNTGETAARATVKVFDGDTKMCEKTSPAAIQPGGSADFYTFCFKMDVSRDLVMKVYEYGKTEELDSFGC